MFFIGLNVRFSSYDFLIHLKNGETLKVKRGCYTTKDIEKVSSCKIKYNSLTGKSVIDPTISQLGPYMKKIPGINNGNYMDTLLLKKIFSFKVVDSCQGFCKVPL